MIPAKLILPVKVIDEIGNPVPKAGLFYQWFVQGRDGDWVAGAERKQASISADGLFEVSGMESAVGYIEISLNDVSDDQAEWVPKTSGPLPATTGQGAPPAQVQELIDALQLAIPPDMRVLKSKPQMVKLPLETIVMQRTVADLVVANVPEGSIAFLGDSETPLVWVDDPAASPSKLHIPAYIRELKQGDPELIIKQQTPDVNREAVLKLSSIALDPYKEAKAALHDDDWQLTAFPAVRASVEIPFLDVATPLPSASSRLPGDLLDSFGTIAKAERNLGPEPPRANEVTAKGKPTGAHLLTFANHGIQLKVRKMATGDFVQPTTTSTGIERIEQVRFMAPSAGSVAGIKVGDPKQKVYSTLGMGNKNPTFGPRTAEYLDVASYFGDGLLFVFHNGVVDRIDFRRPVALAANLQEPVLLPVRNRIFVSADPEPATLEVPAVNQKYVSEVLDTFMSDLRSRIEHSNSFQPTESEDDADLLFEIGLKSVVQRDSGLLGYGVEYSMEPTFKTTNRTGPKAAITSKSKLIRATGSIQPSESAIQQAVRRVQESFQAWFFDEIGPLLAFRTRALSVDYDRQTIIAEAGRHQNMKPGMAFTFENVDVPALKTHFALKELRTKVEKQFPKGIRKFKFNKNRPLTVVAVVREVYDTEAVLHLGLVYEYQSDQAHGVIEGILPGELVEEDRAMILSHLIDPSTGLLYLKLRPVFDYQKPQESQVQEGRVLHEVIR